MAGGHERAGLTDAQLRYAVFAAATGPQNAEYR